MSFNIDKTLPKKLEDELNENKIYKPQQSPLLEALERMKLSKQGEIPDILAPSSSRKSVRGVLDDSYERSMFDEVFGSLSSRSSRNTYSSSNNINPTAPTSSSTSSSSSSSSSSSFNNTILQRLKVLEVENRQNRAQISENLLLINRLEDENKLLRESIEDPSNLVNQNIFLKNQNKKLLKKIEDMEKFLADYNLIWVGDNENDSNYEDEEDTEEYDEDEENEQHILPFNEFKVKLNELNEVIYNEPKKISYLNGNKKHAKLASLEETLEKITIKFYSNGLLINRGPFRKCSSKNYHQFVLDIKDGYFPLEYKDQYPDGVLFELIDYHNTKFTEEILKKKENTLPVNQFLNNLPKKTIKNGEIYNIREEIKNRLNGVDSSTNTNKITEDLGTNKTIEQDTRSSTSSSSSTSNYIVSNGVCFLLTEAYQKQKRSEDQGDAEESGSGLGNYVRVQLKWLDGTSIQTTMYELNTIGELRDEIDKAKEPKVRYELRNAYPSRILKDQMTFNDAGLNSSCTIIAKLIK